MILIGENINIMSKTIGPAIRERQAEPIQEMAKRQAAAGMDFIDLNIGPARKAGDETMEWLVKTVQEVVDLPCSLDTTNHVAIEAGLKVHRGKAIINSITVQPDRMEIELPLVKKYNAYVIAVLWGKEGMPRDANERAINADEFLRRASELGIPYEDIWIDPIVSPVSVEINQVLACLEFMSMAKDILPSGCKTVVGLSNISNGTPAPLRPYINRTFLAMLMKYNLDAAIVDAFDEELLKLARGEMPEILELVHSIMDGNEPDLASLDKKQRDYAKTTRVLLGKTLYSHSWLEV